MTPPPKRLSLAARRARLTSERRLGVIGAFSVVTAGASVGGVAVPAAMFALLVAWFAIAAGYALLLLRLRAPEEVIRAQIVAYTLDVALLTLICASLGGAWWLGPAMHALIVVVAFATIPRRAAGAVASAALGAYLVLGVVAYSGLLGDDPLFQIPSLAGNGELALVVLSLGGLCIVVLTLVLDGAIRWMRRTQERYRGLVQTAPDVIIATDRRGRVVSANEAALALLALPREEMYGMSLRSALPPGMDVSVHRDFRAALSGQNRNFSTDLAVDEERLHFDCSCTPIIEDDQIAGVLLIARDVTQARRDADALRASEEQLRHAQKMEAVGQLAGGIAHDFNNVLSVILGYSQFLRATFTEDDPRLEDVRAMESAAEGAASLTRQLLAFGRKQVVKPRTLDMNECVRDLGEMLKRTLGSDIEIVTSFAAGATVNADPVQIEQIVLNLALNSRDAMPQGGVLTIETRVVDVDNAYRRTHAGVNPGRYVMLSVTDTGMGMDRETQARIFEPFFTTKPQGKGTGLGLPTVYGIVRQNGGHVWVYSELQRGTTFRVYLPLDESAQEATVLTLPDSRPDHGWETILLVDDAERLRPLLSRSLSDRGYEVIEAGNGSEALELSREHIGPIHLLVTDLVMPGLNGPALADELMLHRPDMRVLFMSGYAESAVAAGGRLRRGAAFIAKPFTPDVLAREVRAALDAEQLEVAQRRGTRRRTAGLSRDRRSAAVTTTSSGPRPPLAAVSWIAVSRPGITRVRQPSRWRVRTVQSQTRVLSPGASDSVIPPSFWSRDTATTGTAGPLPGMSSGVGTSAGTSYTARMRSVTESRLPISARMLKWMWPVVPGFARVMRICSTISVLRQRLPSSTVSARLVNSPGQRWRLRGFSDDHQASTEANGTFGAFTRQYSCGAK